MSEVVSCDEVTVNGRAAWRAGAADSVVSVVTITSATLVVASAGKMNCCWTGTCRVHCPECGCGSRTTLIALGLLALGVLITVAVIGLTWTAMPLTVDFIDFNGTVTERSQGFFYQFNPLLAFSVFVNTL